MKAKKRSAQNEQFFKSVGRALRRAAKRARETARLDGTPIYVWKNGRVVAEKPYLNASTPTATETGPTLNPG